MRELVGAEKVGAEGHRETDGGVPVGRGQEVGAGNKDGDAAGTKKQLSGAEVVVKGFMKGMFR